MKNETRKIIISKRCPQTGSWIREYTFEYDHGGLEGLTLDEIFELNDKTEIALNELYRENW